MFGGFGLYRDGIIFGILRSDGDIYLKSDDETAELFQEAGSHPFHYSKDGRRFTMSYWSLPHEALDDPDAVKHWAELAYGAALRSAAAKPVKKRHRAAADAATSPAPRPAESKPARPGGKGARSRPEK